LTISNYTNINVSGVILKSYKSMAKNLYTLMSYLLYKIKNKFTIG